MQQLNLLANQVGQLLLGRKMKLATAESCTGGLVAAIITECSGCSQWFDRGFVTYSNQAKHEMLAVANELIEQHGAVSEQVVVAMAEGALAYSNATTSVAITGIAGPSGGSLAKPVGTVWFSWKVVDKPIQTALQQFSGNRQEIRNKAVQYCLEELIKYIVKVAV